MDAVLVDNLQNFILLITWIAGQKVAEQGVSLLPPIKPEVINNFNAQPVNIADLEIPANNMQIRVIKAIDGELFTLETHHAAKIENQKIVPDVARDLLLLVVINRYQPAKPALAFIEGFGLTQGALASSVAHDSHNIIAVGTNADLLCQAINAVIQAQGGIATADSNGVELLPLPIAGLMSAEDGDSVAARYAELDSITKNMGSTLRAPFMTLSFMGLLVIPELKISDLGLFDGRTFSFTSLTL
jgi:adenine deaminase